MEAWLQRRSGCPINLTLETFGDRWSLIVLRDRMFGQARMFRALLAGNIEGIASNTVADRLARLVGHGLLAREADPGHAQRVVDSLTEAAIGLVPMMLTMGARGVKHRAPAPDLAVRARLLEVGGPEIWAAFMDELRHRHLGAAPPARWVSAALQAADEAALR